MKIKRIICLAALAVVASCTEAGHGPLAVQPGAGPVFDHGAPTGMTVTVSGSNPYTVTVAWTTVPGVSYEAHLVQCQGGDTDCGQMQSHSGGSPAVYSVVASGSGSAKVRIIATEGNHKTRTRWCSFHLATVAGGPAVVCSAGTEPTPDTPPPSNTPPEVLLGATAYAGNEGTTLTFTGSVTDAQGGVLSYAWSLTEGTTSTSLGTGTVTAAAGVSQAIPAVSRTFSDDVSGSIRLTVTDAGGASDFDVAPVTIGNVAPSIVEPDPADPALTNHVKLQYLTSSGWIDLPASGRVQLGTPLRVVVPFTDPGALDIHRLDVHWSWNENDPPTPTSLASYCASTATSVASTCATRSYQTGSGGDGTVWGDHTYAATGNYAIRVVVTDKDGGSDAYLLTQQVVVWEVFATGGGWLTNADGSRTNFGFVVHPASMGTTGSPTGQVQVQPRADDRRSPSFHSTSVGSLEIGRDGTCMRARFGGTGRLSSDRGGTYRFTMIVRDCGGNGSGDTAEIQILEVRSNGTTPVWFTTSGPMRVDGGGRIRVHGD